MKSFIINVLLFLLVATLLLAGPILDTFVWRP